MESSSFDEEGGGPVVELVDLDILKSKLQFGLSERIKYSCIDVSQSWLVCGTAAGSLHVFERGVFKLQRIVPLKEGAVRQIAISEEGAETWIAYGCESRVVGVILLDRRREEIDANWPTLTVDSAPTCLVWSSSLDPGSPLPTSVSSSSFPYSSSAARSLFVGDAGGRVTQCFVSSSRHVNFFRDNAVKLASFDAAVVQLDERGTGGRFLLVSTSRRTYVIDVVRGLYVGVGKKARDSPLGACFVPSSEDSVFRIFAVRPGRRLWEAEMDGRVVRTVQLPSTALDPSRIVARLGSGGAAAVRLGTEEPFLAKVLLEPRSRLLVAHSAHFLHFVRPEDGALVASAVTTVGARIVDVRVAYGSVFVQYRPDEASGSAVVAQLDVRVAGSATSCYPDGDEEEEEFPAVEAEAPLLEDRRPRDGDADFEDGWNRAGTDGWDSDDPDDGYEHGWPVDASMMAVGLYSAEIFQFNDLLFAELSTKMRDRFGRWLGGNEDGGSGRPVKPLPSSSSSKLNDVPGSPVVVVGTKMATDVKTLVKELGEKAKIVTSLLDDRATTAEERRRLGDNWVRYLAGFPDAVLAATRFRFPASAWAAIVPRDVREANADVVLRVVCRARSSSSRRRRRRLKDGVDCPEFDDDLCNGNNYDASSDAEANETLSCLVESSEEEKGWISSLSKVWFLIDGETVLEELTSSTVEARPLREKFLLWSIALCILGATSDSSSDLSDERVSSFPKRAWLPRVRAAVDAGLVDAARLGDLCSRVEDPAKPVELLFLLASAARRAGGGDGGAFRSSLATAFEDFWRATRGREACRSALAEASRVGPVARAALEEVYEDPAARTTLVEIGKTAGWLDEGTVVKLLTRCVEECRGGGGGGPSSSRGERLAEVSLRVLGGGKTSELLETLSGSHAFSRRFLTKFMLCCYAEGKYGLDGRTAAECMSTLGADDVRHPPRPMTVPPPSSSSSSSTVPDRSQRPFYHWSAEVDVSRGCCSCGISLRNGNMLFPDAGSGRESGMVAFRCGHVYHAACLPHPGRGADGKTGKICVLCVRWRS